MGNNAAYTQFEKTVITLHRKGVLTLEILDEIAEPYRGTDIDTGGSMDLISNDMDCEQICVLTVNPDFKPIFDDTNEWAEGEAWSEAFIDIRHDRWGWR